MPGGPCDVKSVLRVGRTAASVLSVAVGEKNSLCPINRRMGLTSKPKAFFEDSIYRQVSPELRDTAENPHQKR